MVTAAVRWQHQGSERRVPRPGGRNVLQQYVGYTGDLAQRTPETRNRIVDFWRVVAIGVVVIGHWMAASIWKQPDGEIALLNSLEWVPYAGWITWIVQVMPVFFLAGGYANARGLRKVMAGEQSRRDWITQRTRRLWTPVIPLLLVWVALIIALRPFLDPGVVYAGAMSATVPLWFLAVYISLTALAPFAYRWWLRSGSASIVLLAVAAVAVDVARFVFDVPGIGWLNFVFVWAAVHQIGFYWARCDDQGGMAPRTGWLIAGTALGALVVLTAMGWYPVAMVGVPGAGVTNMTPPTFAMLLLGVMQMGVLWGTAATVKRWMAGARAWHAVVGVSGVIMTIYLWHLSAMSLVAAAGLNVFGGAAFEIEPGTTTWWLTRPLWLVVLGSVTAGLVALFARYEWRISDAPTPIHRRIVTAGVLLTAGSAAAVARWGITTPDAEMHWIIPGTALLGAGMLGALPRRKSKRPQ
jgi:hypothetical protein